MTYDLHSVLDNQKDKKKNTFQATSLKVEENSRTFSSRTSIRAHNHIF